MTAYYSEHDPVKAAVIREAIKAGAIAPGDVDERSIKDVTANDVMGYRQCHWFAGGGFWSLALRSAGWPDNREVWTGSCPCPSFSAAGKGGGFDDPRHLWPDWFRLIRQCRPSVVIGEQVSAAIGYGWFDLVHAEMEAEAYAVGALVLGAHSVGAPHIRQRLYFIAELEHAAGDRRLERRAEPCGRSVAGGRGAGECADAGCSSRYAEHEHEPRKGSRREAAKIDGPGSGPGCTTCKCSNPDGGQSGDGDLQRGGEHGLFAADRGASDSRADANPASEGRGSGRSGEAGDDYDATERSQGQCEPERLRDAVLGSNAELPSSARHGRDGGEIAAATGLRRGLGDSGELLLSGREPAPDVSCSSNTGGQELQECVTPRRNDGHPACTPARTAAECGGDFIHSFRGPGWLTPEQARSVAATGATRGFWADCDWWYGRDGKYRPAQSRVFEMADGRSEGMGQLRHPSGAESEGAKDGEGPLCHRAEARVGRLRLYGDAICVPLAQAFIESYLEIKESDHGNNRHRRPYVGKR